MTTLSRFSLVRTAGLKLRLLMRGVARRCARIERDVQDYCTKGPRQRRISRVLGILLFGCMTVGLMGTDECASCRPVLSMFLPSYIANEIIDQIEDDLFNVRNPTAHPRFIGTDNSQTGVADFVGNFTSVNQPSGSYFLLGRTSNCSLTLITGTSALNGSATATGATSNYELTLHQLASLTTTPDVFAHGCGGTDTGLSSRLGLLVGKTTQGVMVSAVVSNSGTNGVYIFNANSALTSFTFNSAAALPYATGLNTADLNGDGNGDLVVVNGSGTTSPNVSVLLGNADGSFQTPVSYPVGGSQYTVAAVIEDVNGDGKLDIVTVSNDQQISVLLGNGNGTFQTATSFAAPTLPGYTSNASTPILSLITADVNGDGKKDIICSNGLVLLGNGTGGFTAVSTAAFPYTSANPGGFGPGLAAGDINNDGKVDLVVDTGGTIATYIGSGSGTFTRGVSYVSINNSGYVTLTDLDGDGNLDIYTGLANGNLFSGDDSSYATAYVLMGHGDGTFAGASQLKSGAYNGTNLGDVNGDGYPDVITNSSGAFAVQLGGMNGVFATASTFTAPASFSLGGLTFSNAATSAPSSYVVADINGDNKADLVFVDNGLTAQGAGLPITYSSPVLFVALSNGNGTFQTPVPYAFPQIASAPGFDNSLIVTNLQLADVNKDGKADLIFTYNEIAGGTTVTYNLGIGVLLGNGNGTFSSTPILTSTYSSTTAPNSAYVPVVLNTVDLNNDSKPDLVVNSPTFSVATGVVSQLETFIGNGDGTFKAPVAIASANQYGTPVLADFNKDGKLDIAFIAETAGSQGELVTALGNGDGTFATPVAMNLTGGDAVRSDALAAADFNGDGNVDVALFDNSDYSGIFYGKGDGTFTSVPGSGFVVPKDLIFLAATNGLPAVAVDLNKDGKPDILAGSTILLNEAEPVVLTSSTTALSTSTNTVTVGGSVTFTATVTPASGTTTPTGTVTFIDGSTTLGTGTLNGSGVATYTTTALAVGTHSVTASYGGDTNYSGSISSAVAVTVNSAPVVATSTALMASSTNAVSGTNITFTAMVTPGSGTLLPTGTVTFMDGSTTLGTGTLNGSGVATYATSALAVGTHTVTAAYGGATGATIFNGSLSTGVTVTITMAVSPSYTIGLSSTTTTVVHGNPATTTVTLTPTGGFTGSATVTCTGAPANSLCGASPATIAPSGTNPATCTVTLQTSVMSAAVGHDVGSIAFAGLLGGFGLLALRRRRLRIGLLGVAMLAVLAGASGCGGKGNSTQNQTVTTAPGTYNLTITATSGTIVQSAPWTVTVQ